jgi:hypothetical protein
MATSRADTARGVDTTKAKRRADLFASTQKQVSVARPSPVRTAYQPKGRDADVDSESAIEAPAQLNRFQLLRQYEECEQTLQDRQKEVERLRAKKAEIEQALNKA